PHDEAGDQQGGNRIGRRLSADGDEDSGGNDARGRECVAQHVDVRAPDVQVVARRLVQPDADAAVDHDARRRNADHHPAVGRRGMAEARDRLPGDQQCNHEQRHGVYKRGDDADPVIPECHAMLGRLPRNPEAVPGQPERRGIGEVVPGVRHERQAPAEPAAKSLGDDEGDGQRDGPTERASRQVGGIVGMGHACSVPPPFHLRKSRSAAVWIGRCSTERMTREPLTAVAVAPPAPTPEPSPFRRFFANLGPGLITGAADDDPSGISTYSVAGAAFGYLPLWTALFSFPLMSALQLMCARLGLVTGLGLAGVIRRRYSPWVLWGACLLLVIANVINIAADLGGMAEATRLVTGAPVALCVPIYGIVMVWLLMWSSYRAIARVFKWLTLVLLAYVL